MGGLVSTVFKKALKSTVIVELAGIVMIIGENREFAGCETVTVLARFDVEMRSTIGMSKLFELVETSGAANQKAVSVCPEIFNENSKTMIIDMIIFFKLNEYFIIKKIIII